MRRRGTRRRQLLGFRPSALRAAAPRRRTLLTAERCSRHERHECRSWQRCYSPCAGSSRSPLGASDCELDRLHSRTGRGVIERGFRPRRDCGPFGSRKGRRFTLPSRRPFATPSPVPGESWRPLILWCRDVRGPWVSGPQGARGPLTMSPEIGGRTVPRLRRFRLHSWSDLAFCPVTCRTCVLPVTALRARSLSLRQRERQKGKRVPSLDHLDCGSRTRAARLLRPRPFLEPETRAAQAALVDSS